MKQSPSKFGFSEQRILVAGLARNCGKSVQNDVLRLLAALKSCRELSWLVIESDSSDNTADALGSLSAKIPGFRSISLGTLREKMPLRTQRIAHCRNAYLEELNSNPLYAEIDYVVVADLDGINRLVTPEGFASAGPARTGTSVPRISVGRITTSGRFATKNGVRTTAGHSGSF